MKTRTIHRSIRGVSRLGYTSASACVLLAWLLAAGGGTGTSKPVAQLSSIPAAPLIGSTFTFRVSFRNLGTVPGYIPYLDLWVDAGGADDNDLCPDKITPSGCDGLTILGYAGDVDTGYNQLGFQNGIFDTGATDPCSATPNTVTHPFSGSGVPSVTTCAGGRLAVIKLSNGVGHSSPNFQPFHVDVTVQISTNADVGSPLMIMARTGYAFGNSPTDLHSPVLEPGSGAVNNPCGPGQLWNANQTLAPVLFTLSKIYYGAENEAATGPNNLRYYGLVVDIAPHQTITDLDIEDRFPINMVFQDPQNPGPLMVWQNPLPVLNATAPNYFAGTVLVLGTDYTVTTPLLAGQPNIAPNNQLHITLSNPITGTPGSDSEVAVAFACFIPENDANQLLVLDPVACSSVLSTNDVSAQGQWTPTDCRDPKPNPGTAMTVVSDVTTDDHILQAKCVAIQKSWNPGPQFPRVPGNPPNNLITYVLRFQISDYRTLDQITVVDYLSDGQHLVPGTATLRVRDRYGATPGAGTAPFTPGVDLAELPNQTPRCRDGTLFADSSATKLTFDVSALIAALNLNPRHGAGILTGGFATQTGSSQIAAEGEITFDAEVDDQFQHPQGTPAGTLSVDKSDFLDNCVTLQGRILNNVDGNPASAIVANGGTAEDQSQVQVPIAGTKLHLGIYQIARKDHNPSTITSNPVEPVLIAPGDEVTFRLQMTLPTSDGENLALWVWPSGPVFKVDDVFAVGGGFSGENWATSGPLLPTPFASAPAPGKATDGPLLPSPLLSFNAWHGPVTINAYYPGNSFPSENTLEFLYGSFNDTANAPRVLDILYTLTATSEPFGDGYGVISEATECEDNTFFNTTNLCTSADVRMFMGEPKLRLTKGVVATDDPNAIFDPPSSLAGLIVNAPNTCPRLSGPALAPVIDSTDLANSSFPRLTTSISSLAANSTVTFAIVVENLGRGPRGAFRVTVRDNLPSCFTLVPGTVCAQYGDPMAPLAFTFTAASTATAPELVLTDPNGYVGALGAYDATSGANIVIVTLDALYSPPSGTQAGDCCVNEAELTEYSNVPLGANFVTTPPRLDLVEQATDDAQVCFSPSLGPIIMTCPDDIITNCISSAGAWVNFVCPTATSANCASVPVSCDWPSPGLFPIGVTTVTSTAMACGQTETCTFTVTVVGQGGPPLGRWARSDGGKDAQTANALAVDRWGNSFVAGSFVGGAAFFPPGASQPPFASTAGGEVFLAKYDTTGAFLWAIEAGGPGNDEALGVAVDAQGNSFVTGFFDTTATFSSSISSGGSAVTLSGASGNFFLAKYDPQGSITWAVATSGSGHDGGTGVAVDGNGDCYVTGTFASTTTFTSWASSGGSSQATPIGTGTGSLDCYLARYSSAGAAMWVDASGGVSVGLPPQHEAQSRGLAVDASGKTWIVGIFRGIVPFGANTVSAPGGNWSAFVAHHDGPTLGAGWSWARQTSCGSVCGSQDGRAIGVDATGNSYFTAYYTGDAAIVGPPTLVVTNPNGTSLNDSLVGSFDPSGTPRWLINALPPSLTDQEPRGLAVDPAGDVYVTGFLKGPGVFAAAGNDVWLRKYDGSNGMLHLAETGFGTTSQGNTGWGLAVDPAGCVYVAGSFVDPLLAFSSFVPASAGQLAPTLPDKELFLVKYCAPCGCVGVFIANPPTDTTVMTPPSQLHPGSFTVTAGGSPPFQFFWERDGVPINPSGGVLLPSGGSCFEVTVAGSTSTLTLTCFPAGGSSDLGIYTVTVANQWCCDCPLRSQNVRLYCDCPKSLTITLAADSSHILISFDGTPGHVTELQHASAVTGPWTTIATAVTPEDGHVKWSYPAAGALRYYRLSYAE